MEKYRAWHKKHKKMYQVQSIHWQHNDSKCLVKLWRPNGVDGFIVENNDIVLMRSVGRKDKNGNNVFFGDIVKFVLFGAGLQGRDRIYIGKIDSTISGPAIVVRLGTHDTSFHFHKYTYDLFAGQHAIGSIEIIGDVHENESLLS